MSAVSHCSGVEGPACWMGFQPVQDEQKGNAGIVAKNKWKLAMSSKQGNHDICTYSNGTFIFMICHVTHDLQLFLGVSAYPGALLDLNLFGLLMP